MTRKKITALTLSDTLSREMTSCGATSMATVRRLTFTILSTKGISRMTPGRWPLLGTSRPRRKTTARSYSRRILTDEDRTNTARMSAGTM